MDWGQPLVKANKAIINTPEKLISGGKDSQKTNEKESKQLILRSKEGIFYQNYDEIDNQQIFICKEKSFLISSKDGNLLICGNDDKLQLFSFIQHKITAQKQMKFIQNVGFSNSEKFIICVDRLDKDTFNIFIFETTEMKELTKKAFDQLQNLFKMMSLAFLQKIQIHLLNMRQKHGHKKMKLKFNLHFNINKCSYKFQEMDSFFITNDQQSNTYILLLLNEHFQGFEQKHGMLTIYDYKTMTRKLEKKIEMAQQMTAYLSPDNTILLLLAQNSHDQTNQSYYGQMQLLYYNFTTSVFKQVPTYEGPIHDISWSPNSQQFIVISGFMPCYSVLFNKNCEPEFEFGKHHRNFVTWNKQNRFVIIAGFGNLSGDIDIWDAKLFQQIGFCSSKGASLCVFAPDGRNFLTACVTPRLRVNNHYQVFHYNGQKKILFNYSHSELYEVIWRPENTIYQERPASANGLLVYEEQKNQIKPKRMFQPKGTCKLAEQLKAEKQSQGARKLNSYETFGSKPTNEKPKQNYPPGYVPDDDDEKPKKKKKKNKKKQVNQQESN